MKKKILSLLCVLAFLLTLFAGCGSQPAEPGQTTDSTPETTSSTLPVWETGKEALQGKRIIFLGNSYTFCGMNVMTKQNTVLTQDKRTNDQGFFHHLCKANGIDVEVTNWSFGSHSITDLFNGECEAERECKGEFHEYYLKDRYFDYVVIQCNAETSYTGDFLLLLKDCMDFFRAANPDVKFLMHVPHMAYEKEFNWTDDLKELTDAGFKIANWGELIYDVLEGKTTVPDATQDYSFHSFVIHWSETDGFHQNILAGYLTSLMVYCAITGESAVGQPWEFTNDSSLNPSFSWEKKKAEHYSYDPNTNFIEIFQSEADMHGLQELADQYLEKYNGVN